MSLQAKDVALKTIIILLVFTILCSAFAFFFLNLEKTRVKEETEEGSIHLCFTKEEDCTSLFVDLILNSTSSKAAIYDLDYAPIKDAILQKNTEILIFEDNYEGIGESISSRGLMHNKFFLIYNHSGKDYLITGSTNPTENDLLKNHNNVIIINSKTIFENYEKEFDELKNQKAQAPTEKTLVNLSGSIVENYFCPDDNCEEEVLLEIRNAKNSIYFMTFSFTSDFIGREIQTKQNYIEVRGVFDKSQVASNKEHSEYYALNDEKNIRKSIGSEKLHHKVFIIDNATVITGSYNPTSSGTNRNDENIIIVHDAKVAQEYIQEFERIWAESQGT
jgi:phosphatidylserine/phosphatidylglycerophosphate/cardiolipin synthase-like enzyme